MPGKPESTPYSPTTDYGIGPTIESKRPGTDIVESTTVVVRREDEKIVPTKLTLIARRNPKSGFYSVDLIEPVSSIGPNGQASKGSRRSNVVTNPFSDFEAALQAGVDILNKK